MRLLHLSDRLSDRGGAFLHLAAILDGLARSHAVVLAVGRTDPGVGAPCRVERAQDLDAATRRPVAAALEALWQELRPDAIHVHNVMNPEALAWAASRDAIMTVQDHRAFCPGRGKLRLDGAPCTAPMERSTCASCFEDKGYFQEILATTEDRLAQIRRMRAVVVLSRYMRRELEAVGVDSDRIQVIPPFVAALPDLPAPRRAPDAVLFVGRLVQAKGTADAIEIWRRSGVDLPLVFVGTGAERRQLEAQGFEVTGWLARAELAAELRRGRALLMPSRWQEPFGIVGLEALSLGVPVVAWRSGGIEEWHPAGRALAAWGDLDALAGELRAAVQGANAGRAATPAWAGERDGSMAALLDLYAGRGRDQRAQTQT